MMVMMIEIEMGFGIETGISYICKNLPILYFGNSNKIKTGFLQPKSVKIINEC